MIRRLLSVAGGVLIALGMLLGSEQAAAQCMFPTSIATEPPVVAPDTNMDGFCEWPTGEKRLKGAITFNSTARVEFRGATALDAKGFTIDNGAILRGTVPGLKTLHLDSRGAFTSNGTLDIQASNNIKLWAPTNIDLLGATRLSAAGTASVRSGQGKITIGQSNVDVIAPGAFAVRGCDQTLIVADSANSGGISINNARIGGRVIRLDTRSMSLTGGPRLIHLFDHVVVTTLPASTGCAAIGQSITLDSGGNILIEEQTTVETELKAILRTLKQTDNVCLRDSSKINVPGQPTRPGLIDASGVRGAAHYDDTSELNAANIKGPWVGPMPCM